MYFKYGNTEIVYYNYEYIIITFITVYHIDILLFVVGNENKQFFNTV